MTSGFLGTNDVGIPLYTLTESYQHGAWRDCRKSRARHHTAEPQRVRPLQGMSTPRCRGVLDAELPTATIAKEIRSCGYAHIGPGLFPATYVKALAEHVQQWDGNTTDAFHSGAAGGRLNVVPPPDGPFGGDQPFSQPKRALYELMQRVLSPGRCCHLFLLSVMLALPDSKPHVELPASGDQLWHRDQLRRFRKSAPWTKGEWNHYYGVATPRTKSHTKPTAKALTPARTLVHGRALTLCLALCRSVPLPPRRHPRARPDRARAALAPVEQA